MSSLNEHYDVVIVGGAMMGSSAAWWLSREPGFDGSVLVIERDPSYEHSSTSATNSCVRQQFSNEVNIRVSQFTAEFIRTFPSWFDGADVPELATDYFGYLYLATDTAFADVLEANQQLQASWGAATRILDRDELATSFPFYNLDDIVCGSHNPRNEGYFDGGTMFDTFRTQARHNGVTYHRGVVTEIDRRDGRVAGVVLDSGDRIACDTVVNAAGPRAAQVARMAGLELPVEPRKRFTYVFRAAEPLDRPLPLTIDPSGVHVRSDGDAYMAGCGPDIDDAVEPDDLAMDADLWEEKVWPVLAHRIPAFERIKVVNRWAGHYAFNTLDQNAVIGPHPELDGFVFLNGFSGHGLQQAPAMGRGVAEWISYGEFRSIDLSPLGVERIIAGQPFAESAVI